MSNSSMDPSRDDGISGAWSGSVNLQYADTVSGTRGTDPEANFASEDTVTSASSLSLAYSKKRRFRMRNGAQMRKRQKERLAVISREISNEACKRKTEDDGINDPKIAKIQGPNPFSPERVTTETAKETGVRMALIAEDGSKNITSEMVNPIRTAIWEMLENTPDPLPVINAGILKAGMLHFYCEGTTSAQWLCGLNGRVIEGIKLKVVSTKDLPKPVKMAWKTRNTWCLDISKLLNILQRFNPSLNTDYWKVVNTIVEENHVRRIVFMDKASADYIKSRGYSLQSGMDRSIFKVLEQPDGKTCDTELDVGSLESHRNEFDMLDIWEKM